MELGIKVKKKITLIQELIETGDIDKALLVLIKDKGSDLSPKLCKEFINNLQVVIKGSLSLLELEIAADSFIKAEKRF